MPKPLSLTWCALALLGGAMLTAAGHELPDAAAAVVGQRPGVQVPTAVSLPTARPLQTVHVPTRARAGASCSRAQQGLTVAGTVCHELTWRPISR